MHPSAETPVSAHPRDEDSKRLCEAEIIAADLHYNALKASGELDRRRDAEALRIQVAFGNANLPEFLR